MEEKISFIGVLLTNRLKNYTVQAALAAFLGHDLTAPL